MLRVTAGTDAVFMATEYNTTVYPSVNYTWNYNDSFISDTSNQFSGQNTSKLTIINAQESDGGNYTCFIAIGGASGEATAQLFVCEFKNKSSLQVIPRCFKFPAFSSNVEGCWDKAV